MKIYVALLSLSVLIACKDKKEKPKIDIPPPPVMMNYSIIKTYPHDTSSYTQGLQIYKGNLYEGTGNYGFSKLMKVNLATGEILQSITDVDERFPQLINDLAYTPDGTGVIVGYADMNDTPEMVVRLAGPTSHLKCRPESRASPA
ncbi:MAG TPA: glutaminyl-peptide cyclotransferase [Chitinophagaceae bacterium]|nr:glutaminyl-peptide cyclotransferase [Chitinophagaceae bacterium]